jgi:prepilin-type N-terminal cleavage/methylation domain-containing protein
MKENSKLINIYIINNMENKKAFTLIELLIVIAIIGILASVILVSMSIIRNRAKDNSFKTTAKSAQNGLVSCCIGMSTLISYVTNTTGDVICSSGGKYPDSKSMESIIVESGGQCDSNGNFKVTIKPGSKNKGTIDHAVITSENITYHTAP